MNQIEKKLGSAKKTRKRATQNPARIIASHAVDAMLEKKAHDVTVMDMRNVSGVADYFVIGTGDSELQIKAIVDEIRARIRKECEERPWHVEGTDHWQWVLVDYVDVVAHVFSQERRSFYDLERLWGDAPREVVADEGSAADVHLLAEGGGKATSKRKAGGE